MTLRSECESNEEETKIKIVGYQLHAWLEFRGIGRVNSARRHFFLCISFAMAMQRPIVRIKWRGV